MRKEILVICPYPQHEAPGQRLKYEQYFDFLAAQGYKITVSPFFEPAFYRVLYRKGHFATKMLATAWGYLKRCMQMLRVPFYDGVYVFLFVTPFGSAFFERCYRLLARRMVYDIDDLAYMGKTTKVNAFVSWLRRPGKYFYLMRAADHVITCTPYLDALVRRYNTRTTDISSTIDTDKYIPANEYVNARPLTLGWSGSHSTAVYLRLLSPVLRELRKEREFKLLVIGAPSFEIEGVEVEVIPWSEATEVRDLSRIDIGLYPLPDEEWVLGKSGLKALQYMALGIPTVATAIGANFRVIEEGVSGFLVKTPEQWQVRLRDLLDDPGLRRRIGEAARERVVRLYSVRANEPVYLDIFRRIYG
jgi:L-malate glycosyltransferase